MEQRISINSFSYMRIIACFSIIVLHLLFASSIYFGDAMSSSDIVFEKDGEHMLMWAVPMFLMITGALLLDPKRELTKAKLFRYMKRVVLALLVFSLIFRVLQCVMESAEGGIIKGWISAVFKGESWAHMWYLYLMIVIYLMLPLLKKIVAKTSQFALGMTIVFLLAFSSLVPMLLDFDPGITFGCINIHLSSVIYPTYLFIGYYLFNYKMNKWLSVGLFVACSAAIIAGTLMTDDFSAFTSYSAILVVGQAAGLFGLMIRIPWKADKLVLDIDKCTFGIYLIHMIGVRGLMKWAGFNPYTYGPFAFLFIAIILFIVSYAISTLVKRIPKVDLL